MAWFQRKPKVRVEQFVRREVNDALSLDLDEIFESCDGRSVDRLETHIFASVVKLIAMSLAHLSDETQRACRFETSGSLVQQYGADRQDYIDESLLTYIRVFYEDVANGLGDRLPNTLSLALNRMIGVDDESVVMCRLGLLGVTVRMLKVNVDFYKDIKIV